MHTPHQVIRHAYSTPSRNRCTLPYQVATEMHIPHQVVRHNSHQVVRQIHTPHQGMAKVYAGNFSLKSSTKIWLCEPLIMQWYDWRLQYLHFDTWQVSAPWETGRCSMACCALAYRPKRWKICQSDPYFVRAVKDANYHPREWGERGPISTMGFTRQNDNVFRPQCWEVVCWLL